MSGWQLVVHENADCLDELESKVRDVLKALIRGKVSVSQNVATARNIEAARRLLENQNNQVRDCGLLVIGSHVPAGPKSSVGAAKCDATIRFIREMREAHPRLSVVILGKPEDSMIGGFAMGLGEHAAHVPESQGFLDQIGAHVEAFLGRTTPRLNDVLELDITLGNDGALSNWSMRRKGRVHFTDSGYIMIDPDKLRRIADKSESIADLTGDRFSMELKNLAEDLDELLFGFSNKNRELWGKFVSVREQVGGIGGTQIRFTVDSHAKPALLEALKGFGANYWALNAPIFRRYARLMANRLPLFKDPETRKGPVNCLLIAAAPDEGSVSNDGDPAAARDGWSGAIPALTHATQEVHAIRDILIAAQPLGVGRVEVLELGEEDDPKAALEEQLKSEWHLLHFAGHGVVGRRGAGLVLSAEGGGVMPISDLANKVLTTRFFFISSCRSGDTAFVLPALESFIPAVTGFRWRVDDNSASQFAVEFYRALFDRTELSFKYLEYAFLKARRKLYESSSQDPVWVNPVLVMQLAESEPQLA